MHDISSSACLDPVLPRFLNCDHYHLLLPICLCQLVQVDPSQSSPGIRPGFPSQALQHQLRPLLIRQRMHRWLSSIFTLLSGLVPLILSSRVLLSSLFPFPRTFLLPLLFLFWPSLLYLPRLLLLLLQHRPQHFSPSVGLFRCRRSINPGACLPVLT